MNLLIWFGFIGIAIFYNWFLIEKKKLSPWHPLNAAITCIFAIVFCYYDTRPLWFNIPCALITYWFAFDTGLNIARGEPIQYLGTGSIIDRLCKPYEAPIFWFKFIAFVAFTGMYYTNF